MLRINFLLKTGLLRSTCLDFQTTECHSVHFQSRRGQSWPPPSPLALPDARNETIRPHYFERWHSSCFGVGPVPPAAVGVVEPFVVCDAAVACWAAWPLTPCWGCKRCCSWQSSSSCSCCGGRTRRLRGKLGRRRWSSQSRNRGLIFLVWGFRCSKNKNRFDMVCYKLRLLGVTIRILIIGRIQTNAKSPINIAWRNETICDIASQIPYNCPFNLIDGLFWLKSWLINPCNPPKWLEFAICNLIRNEE